MGVKKRSPALYGTGLKKLRDLLGGRFRGFWSGFRQRQPSIERHQFQLDIDSDPTIGVPSSTDLGGVFTIEVQHLKIWATGRFLVRSHEKKEKGEKKECRLGPIHRSASHFQQPGPVGHRRSRREGKE